MIRGVGRYVERCNMCQRMKNRTEEVAGKLKLSKVPEKLWTHLIVDFITKLPLAAEKDAILVLWFKTYRVKSRNNSCIGVHKRTR